MAVSPQVIVLSIIMSMVCRTQNIENIIQTPPLQVIPQLNLKKYLLNFRRQCRVRSNRNINIIFFGLYIKLSTNETPTGTHRNCVSKLNFNISKMAQGRTMLHNSDCNTHYNFPINNCCKLTYDSSLLSFSKLHRLFNRYR